MRGKEWRFTLKEKNLKEEEDGKVNCISFFSAVGLLGRGVS